MRMIALMLAVLAADAATVPPSPPGAPIVAAPVRLDPRDPARVRLDGLTFLGGWVLTSADARFGGLSSLTVDRDGLLAVSDRGGLFRLTPRGGLPPEGKVLGELGDGPPGRRDSESSTRGPGGALWVGFEGANAIWRYAAHGELATGHVEPAAMADWPRNGGPEALVRLPDGRFLIFSEEAAGSRPGTRLALLFPGDPVEGAKPVRFDYKPPAGYVVTDAAGLPDGRLAVLHRRYTPLDGASAILSIVDPATVRVEAVVEGRRVARLAPPLTVDNMEALAVTREGDATILWVASDDNFSSVQRTLLMRFRLD